jgi:hypothetical protein
MPANLIRFRPFDKRASMLLHPSRAAVVIAGWLGLVGLTPLLSAQTPERARAVFNADAFFDSAQIVALGRVTAVSVTSKQDVAGPGGDVVRKVDLTVDRCYKAPVRCEAAISLRLVNGGLNTPWIPVDIGTSEVVFLKDTPDGLSPVDDWAVWQVDLLPKANASDLSSPSGKNGLKIDLSSELTSPDQRIRMQGLYYLRQLEHPIPEEMTLAQGILHGRDISFAERLSALALLLTDPQPEDIAVAADFAEQHADDVKQNAILAGPIGGGLGLARNPQSIPDLIRIAKSPVEWWHAGALTALRKIRNPIVIPALVSSLEDPDHLAAYVALITLAEMTKKGGEFGPGRGVYDKDPQEYIALWKHWWETEGRAEYGTVADQQAH